METPKLETYTVHRGTYRDLPFEIKQRASHVCDIPQAWTYYVYIHESVCANFAALWHEDELKEFSSGRKYVSHDYMAGLTGEIDMHGGITYYAKHGHTEGFRCVEIGCDYQHYYDTGRSYCVEDVLSDVMHTIDHIYTLGIIAKAEGQS